MMSNIEAIFTAIEFMETHLCEPIGMADVAEAVSYSLYYFGRMFNEVVHHTPYDYLIRRRLTASAADLLNTDRRITDIAFTYQFNNLETYSRAFRRMFAMQPSQWRKQGFWDWRYMQTPLQMKHLVYRNQADFVRPLLVEQDELHLIGIMSLIRHDDTDIAQLWEMMAKIMNVVAETCYGIVSYVDGSDDRFYLAGVAETAVFTQRNHPLLIRKTISAHACARFFHPGSASQLDLLRDYIYQTWLPRSGQVLNCSQEILRYPFPFSPTTDTELLIPLA